LFLISDFNRTHNNTKYVNEFPENTYNGLETIHIIKLTFGVLHLDDHPQRLLPLVPRTQRRPVHLRDARAADRLLLEMHEQLVHGFARGPLYDFGHLRVGAGRNAILQRPQGVEVLLWQQALAYGAHH